MSKSKNLPPRLGRPLGFDPEAALEASLALFWRHGLTGVSLDMVSEATGVARPSLARAFGDKKELYLKCMDHYRMKLRRTLGATLRSDAPIEECLTQFCMAAIDLYVTGAPHPLGCLVINTAPSAAIEEPDVKAVLKETLDELDQAVAYRLRASHARGEVNPGVDVASAAYLTTSLVHSLAVRARAGEPVSALRKSARAAMRHLLR